MEKLNLPVEEFTTPDPITAPEETSFQDLIALMSKHGIRHLPIVKDRKVVGIVSERDLHVISKLGLTQKLNGRASDIMSRNPVTVSSTATLDQVAYEMSSRKIGSVIVNEGDRLLGIFTATDALNALIEIVRGAGR